MDLISCPHCAGQVPKHAEACAVCGWVQTQVPESEVAFSPALAERARKEAQVAQVGYVLYAGVAIFLPLVFASAVLAFTKRGSARGTWLESHWTWIIDTFLSSAAAVLLGGAAVVGLCYVSLTAGMALGLVVGLAIMLWSVYRVARGWWLLSERKPVTGLVLAPRW